MASVGLRLHLIYVALPVNVLCFSRVCRALCFRVCVGFGISSVPPEAEIFFLTYVLTDAIVPYWASELLEQPLEATLRSHQ